MAAADVPTPQARSISSAMTSSSAGAKTAVAQMAAPRRQPRQAGVDASIVCVLAGVVIQAFGKGRWIAANATTN